MASKTPKITLKPPKNTENGLKNAENRLRCAAGDTCGLPGTRIAFKDDYWRIQHRMWVKHVKKRLFSPQKITKTPPKHHFHLKKHHFPTKNHHFSPQKHHFSPQKTQFSPQNTSKTPISPQKHHFLTPKTPNSHIKPPIFPI
jgi:hypothetical protein